MDLSQALNIIQKQSSVDIQTLSDMIPLELIEEAFQLTDTVTLRKRKLPLEALIWLLVGMAIYSDMSIANVINQLDILDRDGKPFVAPSALTQRRKTLGEAGARGVYETMTAHWLANANLPSWNGLTLLGVDGVVWRTEDTPDNKEAFSRQKDSMYPQVRMVCQMELSSHLITGSAFDSYDVNEMKLGYREQKQYMLGSRLTLRSRLPELVRQELWGVLLSYNLVRYQMVQMCFNLKGNYLPYQLSFTGAIAQIVRLLVTLPYSQPGTIPRQHKHMQGMAKMLILPSRRERTFPRTVKPRPQKYAKKKNAAHLK